MFFWNSLAFSMIQRMFVALQRIFARWGTEINSDQILFESVVAFTCFSLVTDFNQNFDMYSEHIFTTIMIIPSVTTCPPTVSYDPDKNFNFFLGKMILRFPWKPEGIFKNTVGGLATQKFS